MAPSPVSQAAWRGCIDNIPACKAQSIPWGAQQQVDEESPDGLLAPQPDTAARGRDLNMIEGRYTHTQTGTLPEQLPHTSFILILSLPSQARCRVRGREHRGGEEMYEGGDGERMTALRRRSSSSLLSHQKC